MRVRLQRVRVQRRKDGAQTNWYFRYWKDESLPSGLVKTSSEFHQLGRSDGPDSLTRFQAEAERDYFLEQLKSRTVEATPLIVEPTQVGTIPFGKLAEMWEWDYVERVVGGKPLVAASTREKYRNHLHNHILPRWASTPIGEFRAKNMLDWLQEESGSWYMMTDLRNIMSGIFTKAQEWEILPDTFANPISRVKLPKKWQVYEKRILSEEETVRVLSHLADPNLLICELCVATGARISEVTGLQVKHVDPQRAYIRIEQRHWRGNIDTPKTERSKRTLTIGSLAGRLRMWIESLENNAPESWVFPQHDRRRPMWDSGVRAVLKEAAREENCDFLGFGLHSLRRANITWRQEVGGSSIEASRIAGHASTKMTEEYTVVQLNRQEELTLRIQDKLNRAAGNITDQNPGSVSPVQSLPFPGQNYLALSSPVRHECDRPIHQQRRTPLAKQNGKVQKQKKPRAKRGKLRDGSKQSVIVQLLKRPSGATLQDLMTATGWQAHSVRGFLSAGVGKKMGLQLASSKRDDGQRFYQIR